jgi:hypothetical protein
MKPEQERHRSNSRDTFFEIGILGVSMEGKVALLNPRRTEAAPLALEKDKEVMKELEGKRGEDGLEPENACLRPTPALSCSSFTGVIDDGHAGEMNVSSGMRLCGRLERVLDSPYYGHEMDMRYIWSHYPVSYLKAGSCCSWPHFSLHLKQSPRVCRYVWRAEFLLALSVLSLRSAYPCVLRYCCFPCSHV